MLIVFEGEVQSCTGFCSGPLQSVQRTEMWGVILALQSFFAVHVGVDNLGVVRQVGRLLDDCSFATPLELVTDGDLLILIRRMIDLRGRGTVRVTEVKGHADEDMVFHGRVRELDRLGNDAADEAADFGRRRVGPAIIDARRNLSGVCGSWYPVVLDMHRFFIAISRTVVNHYGFDGTAPDPLIWSAGSLPKRRRIVHSVRKFAMLPGPPAIWLPEVWTDGSLVLDQVTGVSATGAGFFAHQSEHCWSSRRWSHVDHVQLDHAVQSSRGFVAVPGPVETVQRAELWGVILALQSSDAVHVGVDNLGVVRHVGRLLNGHHGSTPFELVTDGDLLVLIGRMLHLRGLDTVRITKVKGHADDGMVLDGRVRELDKFGDDAADEAADFGRRRVGHAAIDARRNLSGVCGRWYPVILDLHRFFVAISRAVVNHDGRDGTS